MLLAETAMLRIGLNKRVLESLLENPQTEPDWMALPELIYLARAGVPPLRQLSARRLAGSHDSQAYATVAQLLFDSDPAIAETALWSIRSMSPERAPLRLAHVFRALTSENPANPMNMRLLCAATDEPTDAALGLLAEVFSAVDSPRTLRELAAELLVARFPSKAEAVLMEALESDCGTVGISARRYLRRAGRI